MNSNLIIENNLKIYDAIKPKNPENSYTVLATINDHVSGKLLALATGTQAGLRAYPDDIQDCHAESLVKRAFKRYLIERVRGIHCVSTNVSLIRRTIKETCEKDLVLFITQFPCGLIKRFEGDEPVDEVTGEIIKRKPGRGTVIGEKCVYVEKDDCLTKIKRWLQVGFQGKKLGQLLGIKCRIKTLLIGNCEPEVNIDYDSYIIQLKQCCLTEDKPKSIEFVDNIRRDEFLYTTAKQPKPVILVSWTYSTNVSADEKIQSELMNTELIVDGRKRGVTKKQLIFDTGKSHRLQIGNHRMREDLNMIENTLKNSYKEENK